MHMPKRFERNLSFEYVQENLFLFGLPHLKISKLGGEYLLINSEDEEALYKFKRIEEALLE